MLNGFQREKTEKRKLFHDETKYSSTARCVPEHPVKHERKILRGTSLQPLQLQNALRKTILDSLFPNISTAIRLFCCIPVS
ncbi:hypothetical protein J6590_095217, partial [Homalodisca vitripennis]